ncbi:MAG: hypothetical protein KAG53_02995 [Endozoicomonadaceae bacterium]|nr:hypothetical protein [Endozoicomonadaceae bacterium]
MWEFVGETWQKKAILEHSDKVFCADFSSDESHIVTASADGTAKIWGCVRKKWQEKASITRALDAKFSPEGLFIVAGRNQHETKIWVLESEQNSNVFPSVSC